MLYAVIIAGGSGKRLWPKSRRSLPKYLLKINSDRTLLQEAIERARQVMPLKNILIITNKEHVRLISRTLAGFPAENIVAEPVSRNTAPAVCLAAAIVKKRNHDGIMFVMPADQVVGDKKAIKDIFMFASFIAGLKDCIVTIGIKPKFAATGYGYIKTGKLYKSLNVGKQYESYLVDSFVEKPDAKKAKAFLKARTYLWNSGIFIARAKTFLEEFKRYRPAIYKTLMKMDKALSTKGQQKALQRYYRQFPDISIDYAVMEKSSRVYVVKADIPWQDVGSWSSISTFIKKDKKGNSIIGEYVGLDLKDSIICGQKGHLIATLGLENIIVVHTKDCTLICSKEREEDIKRVVDILKQNNMERYI